MSASSAFCTCRRFSASSQTADCAAVERARGDLLAGVRGQAVEDDRLGAGERDERLVEAVGLEVCEPPLARLLLAERDPDVGDEDVGARRRPRAGRGRASAACRTAGRSPRGRRRRPPSRSASRSLRARRGRSCRRRPTPTLTPSRAPRRWRIVSASASAWHGCSTEVSALITGISAASAQASSSSCESTRIASASR